MNQLQVFNFSGYDVRVVIVDGNPWWVAKDVCEVLELSNPTVAVQRLDTDEVTKFNLGGLHGETNIVNEAGLYSLIIGSRKPEAKKFKRWVTHEVIPSIRQYGAYLTPEKIEEVLADPDTIITLATQLKKAHAKIEEQKPLVTFAEICMQSDSSVKVRELAHSLSSHGLNIGQNKLFEKLRDWNLICKGSTEPTQRAVEQGLFEIVTGVKQKPSGEPFTWRTPYATVKGQMYVADRLKKERGA